MIFAEAHLRHLPMSPRKVRLVVDLIRGCKVQEARDILSFTLKRSAEPLLKLLQSAVANAEEKARQGKVRIDTDEMKIVEIRVDPGRITRSYQAAPRGRAVRIRHRHSHIHIVLAGEERKTTPAKKK
ncbi:MAG TPA: 50S ribosomal protein L22 [Candidatus Hydrogenedens sp.]|nr:50S ribosomal protein L22 [Candidatus Hydrogenedens sp.]HOK10188.1 50S ribosomal protein L22 [Candidatus Hydrogenedens sp.]HOL20935.1 50S ribosomal protein L22 [Candidatus Hydrogenedens sp.]HPP59736.1 50S ribosomal protein L22 [Candidatus Hydrogenedens sp.]